MTRTKIWTRRLADRRRQDRDDAVAAAAATRARRRSRLLWAAAAVAAVVAFTLAGVHATGNRSPMVVAMSALAGAVLVGSVAVHRALRKRLGGITAVLAMSLVGGALFLTLAATASQCPDSAAVGRCTGGELANWGMVGMLLPLTGAAMLGVPVVIARFTGRVVQLLVRLWKGQPLLQPRSTTPESAAKPAKPAKTVKGAKATKATGPASSAGGKASAHMPR